MKQPEGMYSVELYGRLRRVVFVEGKSQREVVWSLELHGNGAQDAALFGATGAITGYLYAGYDRP